MSGRSVDAACGLLFRLFVIKRAGGAICIFMKALAPAVALLTAVLSACGGTTSTDSASAPGTPTVAPGQPPDAATPRSPSNAEPPTDEVPRSARWCAAQGAHGFCADFDGEKLTEGWRVFGASFKSALSDRSPPRALGVNYLQGRLFLEKSLAASSFAGVTVAFDLRVVEALGEMEPIQLAFASATKITGGALLAVGATGTSVLTWTTDANGETSPLSTPVINLPRGRWVRVALAIAIANGDASATLAYDGTPVNAVPFIVGPVDTPSITQAIVRLGQLNSIASPAAFVADVDNVVADVD